jgi:hypothetical protein
VYLGQDPLLAREWEKRLGPQFHRIEIGRLLDDTARRLRNLFNNWVDSLSEQHGADPIWWLTPLAERNSVVSPLFVSTCYLSVATECLAGDQPPRVIVAESWALIDILQKILIERGGEVQVLEPRQRLVWHWRNLVRAVGVLAYFILNSSRLVWAARRAGQSGIRTNLIDQRPQLLLATYFHESNLSDDGIFRDRYFPYLHEWLEQEGLAVWVLPTFADNLSSPRAKYHWMRNSTTKFIIPEDWLKLADYWGALCDSFRIWKYLGTAGTLEGVTITPLVREEFLRSLNNRTRQASLLRRLPARLQQGGFVPARIVSWSENQIFDKARALGFRKAFSDVAYTAVQNIPLLANWLSMLPTPAECRAKVIGNRIVCSGPLPATIIGERTNGAVPTAVGCALRYQYLWKSRPRASQKIGAVVMTLPSMLAEAKEMIEVLTPLWAKHPEIQWFLKPHPDYSIEDLERVGALVVSGAPWSAIDGSLADWIDRVDLLITSGSGTAVEAAALGMPVILIGSRTRLSLNPLEWFAELSVPICYCAEEVSGQLENFVREPEKYIEPWRERAAHIRSAWFAPVSNDGLREFVV